MHLPGDLLNDFQELPLGSDTRKRRNTRIIKFDDGEGPPETPREGAGVDTLVMPTLLVGLFSYTTPGELVWLVEHCHQVDSIYYSPMYLWPQQTEVLRAYFQKKSPHFTEVEFKKYNTNMEN
jgi:hypothetical protein